MATPIAALVAVCALALLSCQRPADDPVRREKQAASAVGVQDTVTTVVADSATARITITGPTIIVAFPRPEPNDSSHDSFEAYSDWLFYARQATNFLVHRGVRSLQAVADTLRVMQDGKETVLLTSREAPLCYLAAPGRPSQHFSGYDSHADIINAAVVYFWDGKAPVARGDTLTAEAVNADFAVIRPTVIAYFSRRMLNFGRRGSMEYPDSARLLQQVEYLRDSLDRNGVTITMTSKEPFTVFGRGSVDTVRPVGAGGVVGYYVAAPDDWGRHIWVGLRSTPELVQEIRAYLHRARSTVHDDSNP